MIVHQPGDPGYRNARKLFIGRPDEVLPRAVLECESEEDVPAALDMARGGRFAIRGGGHSFAEHSTSDGLVLDLSGLTALDIRDDRVVVGAGVRVGALTDALAPRVVPVGWCRSVGVVGAVLGGGYGVLGRYYGLGADHLVAARVLLADGRIVRASSDEHEDLFWALRGAGAGNFGVVLSIELRPQPPVELTTIEATWPYKRAVDVVTAWQDLAPAAPREVNLELSLWASDFPDEAPAIALFGVVVGTQTDANTTLSAYIDRAGPPSSTSCVELSTVESARHCAYPGDTAEHELPILPPDGRRPALRLARSEFFTTPIPSRVLTELTTHLVTDRRYGVYRDLELIPWGAALSAEAGGAFAHRSAWFLVKHTVQTGSNASDELRTEATSWVNHSWSLTHSVGSGGTYPNYPDLALKNWPHVYHGPHLPRLREIKKRYDPTGVFHYSQGL